MRPTRIRDLKMEIFERIKTILFKSKEEWAVVEAENASHTIVLTKYLLILALIPEFAFFASKTPRTVQRGTTCLIQQT